MGTKVAIGLENGAREASPYSLPDRYKRKQGINDTQAMAVRRRCGLFLETDFDYDKGLSGRRRSERAFWRRNP
jgi:hypothetical protein